MISAEERHALEALLARMRTIHEELGAYHPGICVLHLAAAIAALESHLRRDGASSLEVLRQELTIGRAGDIG